MFRDVQHGRAVKAISGFGFALLTFGMVATGTYAQSSTSTPPAVSTPAANQTAVVSAADIVEQVAPAVVTVVNEQQFRSGAENSLQPVGSGTGFVIDDEGHIVTNW